MVQGLWVYAIGRAGHPRPKHVEAIDGSGLVELITEGPLTAFATPVDLRQYSQQASTRTAATSSGSARSAIGIRP